jgi:hypothetical protein
MIWGTPVLGNLQDVTPNVRTDESFKRLGRLPQEWCEGIKSRDCATRSDVIPSSTVEYSANPSISSSMSSVFKKKQRQKLLWIPRFAGCIPSFSCLFDEIWKVSNKDPFSVAPKETSFPGQTGIRFGKSPQRAGNGWSDKMEPQKGSLNHTKQTWSPSTKINVNHLWKTINLQSDQQR